MTEQRTWGLRRRAIGLIPVMVGVFAAHRFENVIGAILVFLTVWFLTRAALVAIGVIEVSAE